MLITYANRQELWMELESELFINKMWILKYVGPRARRPKKATTDKATNDEKRPRTAFSGPQLARLKVCQLQFFFKSKISLFLPKSHTFLLTDRF